jgi:hypothetical protein
MPALFSFDNHTTMDKFISTVLKGGAIVYLIMLLTMLLWSPSVNAQSTPMHDLAIEITESYVDIVPVVEVFSLARVTTAGTILNANAFAGTDFGRVQAGVGMFHQTIWSETNTNFQAITPQVRYQGSNGFIYGGPAITQFSTPTTRDLNLGVEVGFMYFN